MAKILSIELGHSVIKMCEMEQKGSKPKIYQCQEAITPAGAVQDGYINEAKMNDLAYSIKETIARNGIKTKKVVFTVASAKIITREVTVPNVKESQIPSVVQANLSEYFPVSLADYEVTQSLVQTLTEGADAGKHRVLVFAAEKSLMDQHRKLAAACGLDIMNVCCSGASIIEIARNAKMSGCQAIVKIEEKYSIINIMKDGVLLLQRSINYGVGEAMSEVASQPSFATADTLGVWRLITRNNCTLEKVPNVKEAGRPEAREAVSEALRPLVSGIMRVLDYFGSHFGGEEIENVSIIGLGAQFVGVTETLGEALGIVCKKAGMFQDLDIVDSDVKQKSDAYFSCIGAGFANDGFLHDTGKGKAKVGKDTNYKALSVVVALVAVAAVGGLLSASLLPYNSAKKENDRLQVEFDTYQEGLDAYNELQGMQKIYQKFFYGNTLTRHANDGLLNFLAEMEAKLPGNTTIESFASNDEQCEIRIVVPDKETGAKFVEKLRSFDSVMDVLVSNIEEKVLTEQDLEEQAAFDAEKAEGEGMETGGETAQGAEGEEEDVRKITFTITCLYFPIEADEEVPEAAPAAAPAEEQL